MRNTFFFLLALFMLFSIINVANAVMITVNKENGVVNCRGCRNKTIDGMQYICTGSLNNENCTEKNKFIENWLNFDAKKAEKFNEDMSKDKALNEALTERRKELDEREKRREQREKERKEKENNILYKTLSVFF